MRRRRSRSTAARAAELAFAAPQVVAHRMLRIAAAGSTPTARDRRELQRMVSEKQAAFGEAWLAMAARSMRANQELAFSLAFSAWSPWLGGRRATNAWAKRLGRDNLAVWGEGLSPVHRRAVANAKRLGRPKRRRAP